MTSANKSPVRSGYDALQGVGVHDGSPRHACYRYRRCRHGQRTLAESGARLVCGGHLRRSPCSRCSATRSCSRSCSSRSRTTCKLTDQQMALHIRTGGPVRTRLREPGDQPARRQVQPHAHHRRRPAAHRALQCAAAHSRRRDLHAHGPTARRCRRCRQRASHLLAARGHFPARQTTQGHGHDEHRLHGRGRACRTSSVVSCCVPGDTRIHAAGVRHPAFVAGRIPDHGDSRPAARAAGPLHGAANRSVAGAPRLPARVVRRQSHSFLCWRLPLPRGRTVAPSARCTSASPSIAWRWWATPFWMAPFYQRTHGWGPGAVRHLPGLVAAGAGAGGPDVRRLAGRASRQAGRRRREPARGGLGLAGAHSLRGELRAGAESLDGAGARGAEHLP